MKKVVVIGGGASGIVAAIFAAKNGCDVTILERNNTPLKKVLITGNGKCNYFNENIDINHFHSSNSKKLKEFIIHLDKEKILNFFNKVGIIPKIKNGYYYPASLTSASVKEALLLEAELLNINIKNNILVNNIIKKDNFIISTSEGVIVADKVILSTGSAAFPKTGSDGNGYNLALNFGHTVVKPLPALVALKGNEKYFKDWAGVRCEAKITSFICDKEVQEEFGEIQFTDYGISGVCIFNISSKISRALNEKKDVYVKINLVPFLKINDIKEFINFLDERSKIVTGRNIMQFLEGIIHFKLLKIILKNSNIDSFKYYDELNKKEKYALAQNIVSFKLNITDTNSFDKAQVCTGGINLDEVNPKTMESKKVEGLYLVGEILDVDGECGGFNLGFAWGSGMNAGSDIK